MCGPTTPTCSLKTRAPKSQVWRDTAVCIFAIREVPLHRPPHHTLPEQIAAFMGWIPLVAGSMGALLGGAISDRVVRSGTYVSRLWVLVLSQVMACCVAAETVMTTPTSHTFPGRRAHAQVIAAPFAAGALVLPTPWAYISLLPANVIGEMWVGVMLALVLELTPVPMRVISVGVYYFIIANVGGNMPLLVPLLQPKLGQKGMYCVFRTQDIASIVTRVTNPPPLPCNGRAGALLVLYPAMYLVAAVLWLATMALMRRDLRRKAAAEVWQRSRSRHRCVTTVQGCHLLEDSPACSLFLSFGATQHDTF